MIDLSERSSEREWMETEPVDAAEFARCLGDLATVNRLTLAHGPTLRWLARAVGPAKVFSVLDVGSGEGDMLRAIWRWAARQGKQVALEGIDLDPSSALAAEKQTPAVMEISYRTGDVFTYQPERRPNFIISSLVTHHMTDEQIVAFLRWMEATATRGWFVNDLHRSAFAYRGFKALATVARWHRFVRHDGPLSIARAFRREDWDRLLADAGLAADIRWEMPFRYCVGRVK